MTVFGAYTTRDKAERAHSFQNHEGRLIFSVEYLPEERPEGYPYKLVARPWMQTATTEGEEHGNSH